MSFNPTLHRENGRQSADSGQNVFDIARFRKVAEPCGFNDRTILARKVHGNSANGTESTARIIPFDDFLKHKEQTEAAKRLQQRTGLERQDARNVINSIEKKKIGKHGHLSDHTSSRKKRLFWACTSIAVVFFVFFSMF